MNTIRRSAVLSLFAGGLLLAVLSGCSGGNPNISNAEDAMEQQNYERALANIDTALAQDSANVDAYLMRAQILRNMADSTMGPDEHKEFYKRAREAEEQAIQFDPGARSQVEGQRTLLYTQKSQEGAKAFQRARRTSDPMAYQQAANHFGAASATFPDSASVILNEAFARLNMAQSKEDGDMTKSIPVLEKYVEEADEVQKNAYDILSALYLQNGDTEKAIDLLESARADLSERSTYFQIAGSQGLQYSGTVQENGDSRSVEGTTPDRVAVETEGQVSGSFEKKQEKGQLRVALSYKGTAVRDTTISSGTATLSATLSEETPLAEIEGRLLNAYNQAGQTEKAMQAYQQQIERNPENVTYRYNYGSLLLQSDRFDEAIEQLSKAVEIEPGNVKAQYNLGAAYSNKARQIQDTLSTLNDSMRAVSEAAMENNREPTEEEEQRVNELDQRTNELAKRQRELYRNAIPPLERARQMADSEQGSFRQDACAALVTAYVQTENVEKAQEYEDCAGLQVQQQGNGSGN